MLRHVSVWQKSRKRTELRDPPGNKDVLAADRSSPPSDSSFALALILPMRSLVGIEQSQIEGRVMQLAEGDRSDRAIRQDGILFE